MPRHYISSPDVASEGRIYIINFRCCHCRLHLWLPFLFLPFQLLVLQARQGVHLYLLLVGYDFIRRHIYEKSKKEDTDALLAELEALRAEKAEKEKASVGTGDNGADEN